MSEFSLRTQLKDGWNVGNVVGSSRNKSFIIHELKRSMLNHLSNVNDTKSTSLSESIALYGYFEHSLTNQIQRSESISRLFSQLVLIRCRGKGISKPSGLD